MNNEKIPYRLECMEVWGGNRLAACPVKLPGLMGWVYSKPLEPATAGGGRPLPVSL